MLSWMLTVNISCLFGRGLYLVMIGFFMCCVLNRLIVMGGLFCSRVLVDISRLFGRLFGMNFGWLVAGLIGMMLIRLSCIMNFVFRFIGMLFHFVCVCWLRSMGFCGLGFMLFVFMLHSLWMFGRFVVMRWWLMTCVWIRFWLMRLNWLVGMRFVMISFHLAVSFCDFCSLHMNWCLMLVFFCMLLSSMLDSIVNCFLVLLMNFRMTLCRSNLLFRFDCVLSLHLFSCRVSLSWML